jgi:hypothetical protein
LRVVVVEERSVALGFIVGDVIRGRKGRRRRRRVDDVAWSRRAERGRDAGGRAHILQRRRCQKRQLEFRAPIGARASTRRRQHQTRIQAASETAHTRIPVHHKIVCSSRQERISACTEADPGDSAAFKTPAAASQDSATELASEGGWCGGPAPR